MLTVRTRIMFSYTVVFMVQLANTLVFYGVISSILNIHRKIRKQLVNPSVIYGIQHQSYLSHRKCTKASYPQIKKPHPKKGRGISRYHPNSRHLHIGLSDCVTCSIRYLLLLLCSKIQLPCEIRFLSEPKETYSR